MDPALSRQYFDEQVSKLQDLKGIIEVYRWSIEADSELLMVFVTMRPKNHPELIFIARLKCDDYPQRATSFQFVDPLTKKEGVDFWPKQGSSFQAAISRSQSQPQLCIPGIREFHEGCHIGDASKPWLPDKYPFGKILQDVQVLLNQAYT